MTEPTTEEVCENEVWYDSVIKPKLALVAELCKERDVPFMSAVEYKPGHRGSTYFMPESAGLEMKMVVMCNHTAPNVDGYIFGMKKYFNAKGIDTKSSIVLSSL